MKKILLSTLKVVVFFGVGILLFWLAYKDQNMEEITDAIKSANYFWIGLSLVLGILSHVSRALRWNLLIRPLGYSPRSINAFLAVMVMYLANLALPRLGEVSRCGIMNRYEKIPFAKLLGTVFTERVIDFIMLILLLIFVLIIEFERLMGFLTDNILSKFGGLGTYLPYIIAFVVAAPIIAFVLIIIFRKRFEHTAIYKKVAELVKNFWAGIKTIKEMERKWAFIAHSLFIYIMYFSMIYVCFFAFDFSKDLGITAGLAVFVMASFGMVAPAPGGIGAWHIMCFQTMALYGVAIDPDGHAFAFAVHGTMTLMLIVVGFISVVALPLVNRKKPLVVQTA